MLKGLIFELSRNINCNRTLHDQRIINALIWLD
jgi:hypothetical protein